MIPRFTSKIDNLYVGDVTNGNYTKITTTGEIRNYGLATVWDDLIGNLFGKTLYSNAGKLDYNWKENTITMQSGGLIINDADRLSFNFQKPHGVKKNSFMHLHIHWEQPNNIERIWTIQYRIQNNNSIKNTTWITVTSSSFINNIFAYTTGTLNQITRLASIDLSSTDISSTIQFRVCRTDSNPGDIETTFIDAHVEYDSNGSEEEYNKY